MSRTLLTLALAVGLLSGLFSTSGMDSAFAQKKKVPAKKAPPIRLPTQAEKTEVEVALAKLDQHGIPSSWKWGAVHLDAEILGHYWDYALS